MRTRRLIAHIPARAGSKRVPSKNLRYLVDRPMIAYAIEVGLACSAIDELYVNTDSPVIAQLARDMGCRVYRRPEALGSDDTSGEEFTADFMRSHESDTLLMISPVCPLLESGDIRAAIAAYDESAADTLIACTTTQLQTFCEGLPVNVSLDGPLAPSQMNPQVMTCNWGVTIWNVAVFLDNFEASGNGYFGRDRLLWPIDSLRAVKVSTEADFRLAEALVLSKQLRQTATGGAPRFWTPESGLSWISDDARAANSK